MTEPHRLNGYHPNSVSHRFQPGNPGRTPGQGIHTIRKTLEELGFDPIREAVKRFRDDSLPHSSRDVALTLIFDRVLPKLKAIEISGSALDAAKQVMINIIGAEQPQIAETIVLDPIVSDMIVEPNDSNDLGDNPE